MLPGLVVAALRVLAFCGLVVVGGVLVDSVSISVSTSTVGGGLTSLQADEIKFALPTFSGARPEEPKHSNGPRVKKESLASE